jgi:Fur family transcriptional regulator, ferric uptake regulator
LSRMPSKARERKEEELRQLLAARGIRVTEQRLVILRELAKLRAPISHGELTFRLAGHALDRATIYRNLLSLTDAGILVRTQLGDNVWRFEMPSSSATGHGAHPHFVCTDCGDVSCLPKGAVKVSAGDAPRIEIAEIQLRGRCGECVER